MRLTVLLLLLVTSAMGAQAPVLIRRVPLPALDLVVLWDSAPGITLLASPTLASNAGNQTSDVESLSLSFDSVRAWLPTARLFVDSAPAYVDTTAPRAIGTRLAGAGREAVVLGYDPGRSRDRKYLLTIYRSDNRHWTLDAAPDQLQNLLDALAWIADSASPVWKPRDSALVRMAAGGEFVPPRIKRRPALHFPPLADSWEGRVWARFTVTPEGRVDMGTLRILLSDGASFEAAARRAWEDERFEPARVDGEPVPFGVFQVMAFRRR